MAERIDLAPLLVGVRLGHARRLVDRRTCISCSSTDSHFVHAAGNRRRAERIGVAASGRCPSPASSPDVGSRPTHPAPGRYTSAHACRSVKSAAAPGRTVERLHVWRRAESDSRRRTAPPAPGDGGSAPAASPCRGTSRCRAQRLLGCLHAGLESDDVAMSFDSRWFRVDQEVHRPPRAAIDALQQTRTAGPAGARRGTGRGPSRATARR